jgi:WD40 repeat protein
LSVSPKSCQTFTLSEVVRCLKALNQLQFISSSNDLQITEYHRTSTEAPFQQIRQYSTGHLSFIYCLDFTPVSKDSSADQILVCSSSEDKTVRVFQSKNSNSDLIQVLHYPCNSCWSCLFMRNGSSIVCGVNTGHLIIHSTDSSNPIDSLLSIEYKQELDKFAASAANASNGGGNNGIDEKNVKSINELLTFDGKKEGQIQIFRQIDGSLDAYQWSSSGTFHTILIS